jgi:hypothetical protein
MDFGEFGVSREVEAVPRRVFRRDGARLSEWLLARLGVRVHLARVVGGFCGSRARRSGGWVCAGDFVCN